VLGHSGPSAMETKYVRVPDRSRVPVQI
jgi:hypothetical protein